MANDTKTVMYQLIASSSNEGSIQLKWAHVT